MPQIDDSLPFLVLPTVPSYCNNSIVRHLPYLLCPLQWENPHRIRLTPIDARKSDDRLMYELLLCNFPPLLAYFCSLPVCQPWQAVIWSTTEKFTGKLNGTQANNNAHIKQKCLWQTKNEKGNCSSLPFPPLSFKDKDCFWNHFFQNKLKCFFCFERETKLTLSTQQTQTFLRMACLAVFDLFRGETE